MLGFSIAIPGGVRTLVKMKDTLMNDIWQFLVGISDGFREALGDVNPLPILIVAILIGLLQPKSDRYALKAGLALLIVMAFNIFVPLINGGQPNYPDFRHIGAVAQIFLLYVFAYGMIGVLGSLKAAMKLGATKSAH